MLAHRRFQPNMLLRVYKYTNANSKGHKSHTQTLTSRNTQMKMMGTYQNQREDEENIDKQQGKTLMEVVNEGTILNRPKGERESQAFWGRKGAVKGLGHCIRNFKRNCQN